MKSIFAAFAFGAAALLATQAFATNGLYITSETSLDGQGNIAALNFDGDDNRLSIVQAFDRIGGANQLSINVTGNLNGGPLGLSFGRLPASLGLAPGQIVQAGHDNMMDLMVMGNRNLFAMSQTGAHNALTGTIIGNNNQAAVLQSGMGNSLVFTQNGNGNMLTVVQRSR